ncbi:MAG: KpsF/GutQ family sugar-phosphate isomerase [Planctomycetota bacterium]
MPGDADDIQTFAAGVIEAEAQAVTSMAAAVRTDAFVAAVEAIVACDAAIVTSGVGKAGHVARKVAATFASTGSPSHFLLPGDATHGDLGSVRPGDVVVLFSASGESDELVRLGALVNALGNTTIAICRGPDSSLGRDADIVVPLGPITEACPLRLAPSCSTTAMLALGDALALSVMRQRDFKPEDFARFHPAGALGRKLMRVGEAMTFRRDDNLPLANASQSVGDVLREVSTITRRPGAILVEGDDGKLAGLFSDGDLRRLIVSDGDGALSRQIGDVMTASPRTVHVDAAVSEAVALMQQFRIDELPAVDDAGRAMGLIDVQDLVVLRLFDAAETRKGRP